jgi:hypothetical protein
MDAQCSKCGMQLQMPWIYCPHCGVGTSHEIQPTTTPVQPEHTSTPGAFGGLFFGLLAVSVLIIVGSLLCLTGLGAILGIPMIIAAVLAPLLGPLFGMSEHKGKCPSCGMAVITFSDGLVHDCPVCNKAFAINNPDVISAGTR